MVGVNDFMIARRHVGEDTEPAERIDFFVGQRGGVIHDPQPAFFRCGHQVAGHFGLPVDGDPWPVSAAQSIRISRSPSASDKPS